MKPITYLVALAFGVALATIIGQTKLQNRNIPKGYKVFVHSSDWL
jgi:hypothetical protein